MCIDDMLLPSRSRARATGNNARIHQAKGKGLMFNFPAGSRCNKLWEITSLGQAPKGLQSCYRLNLRGNSTCGKLATNSQRKVLKSSPWARQFFPSISDSRARFFQVHRRVVDD